MANPFGYKSSLLFYAFGTGKIPLLCFNPNVLNFYCNNLITLSKLMKPSSLFTAVAYKLEAYSASDINETQWVAYYGATITYGKVTSKVVL